MPNHLWGHENEEELNRTALHEAGHAVAYHFLGGQIRKVTCVKDGSFAGLCSYGASLSEGLEERHRLAVAAMAGPLTCELVGDPDIFAWPDDYEAAAKHLLTPSIDANHLLLDLAYSWCEALNLLTRPAVWRTLQALARSLREEGTVCGMPAGCISSNDNEIPEVRVQSELVRGDFGRALWEDLSFTVEWAGKPFDFTYSNRQSPSGTQFQTTPSV